MFKTRKDLVKAPTVSSTGEEVFELVGSDEKLGGSSHHSLAYVVIPPHCSSVHHFHNTSEETYFILKGQGKLIINDTEHIVRPGDAVLISPGDHHQIFTEGHDALEFIVTCAPPWNQDDNIQVNND
ncbi:MAG: cupin domain-containing protein [Candidatus Odinarchaeota archaeon]